MTRFITGFVVAVGMAGALVLQHNALSQIRTDLASLKAGNAPASNDSFQAEVPGKRGLRGDKAVAEWLRYVSENDAGPRVRREALQALGRDRNQQWNGDRPR
jgi:hypothetical protein